MTDEQLVANLIDVFGTFEWWNPWHELRFAERAGIDARLFLPAIRSALKSRDWPSEPLEATAEIQKGAIEDLKARERAA